MSTSSEPRAQVKGNAVRTDARALTDDLTEIDVYLWEEVSDLDIGKAMRKIKPWREELNRIVKMWRDLEEMATVAGIQGRPEVHETRQQVKELQALFVTVQKEVEKEDLNRALHTLDISTGAKVSYPNFEGRDDEDWSDFEERMKPQALVSEEKNKFALSVLRRVRVKLKGRELDSPRKVSGEYCLERPDSCVLVKCGGAGREAINTESDPDYYY